MTSHLPAILATAITCFEAHEGLMDIFSPGAALPQMFTVVFCCNTRLSDNMEGRLTFALVEDRFTNKNSASKIGIIDFFMKKMHSRYMDLLVCKYTC